MDLHIAETLAKQLMCQHGLGYWIFEFDRSKKRFGACDYRRKVVSLSRALVEVNIEKEVRDTILHEIAHALTPGDHHGYRWQLKAREIGARPERCYTDETTVLPKPKYIGICTMCPKTFPAFKFGKRMARGKQFHSPCGPESEIVWRKA